MSGVNETKFLVQHQSSEYKCTLNVYVVQSKTGILINVAVSVKN